MLWFGTVEMSVRCYWEFHTKSWVVKQPQRHGKVNLGWWDSDRQEPGWCTEYIFESRRIGRRFWNFPETFVLRTCRGLISFFTASHMDPPWYQWCWEMSLNPCSWVSSVLPLSHAPGSGSSAAHWSSHCVCSSGSQRLLEEVEVLRGPELVPILP